MNDTCKYFKCDQCGADSSLSVSAYNVRKRLNKPFLCKECSKKERAEITRQRMANMDPEEKKNMYKRAGEKHKNTLSNLSDEEKKKRNDRLQNDNKKYRENISDEEKERISKLHSEANKRRFQNISDDEMEIYRQNCRDAYYSKTDEEKEQHRQRSIDMWKNKSDEDYNSTINKMSMSKKEWWNNTDDDILDEMAEKIRYTLTKRWIDMSEEEKEEALKPMKEGYQKWLQSLSEEEKNIRKEKAKIQSAERWEQMNQSERDFIISSLNKGNKRYWSNISEEDKTIHIKKLTDGQKEWWNSLSDDDKESILLKSVINRNDNYNLTGTELEFSNILRINNITYQSQYISKIKYPHFHELFPNNPISGADFVFPFHDWDFRINLRDKSILVDIDGSIHDPSKTNVSVTGPKKNKFNLSDFILFNDSQRPYQTDRLDAYVVKAYNDKIEDETVVMNIKTNKEIKFKDFMNTLLFDNMDDQYKKDLIKMTL